MSFDLIHIWESMGTLGKLIAFALGIMAVACAGVVVERLLALKRSADQSRKFAKGLGPLLEDWDLQGVSELSVKYKASSLARMFRDIANRYLHSESNPHGGMPAPQAARQEAERSKEAIAADLRRGMSVLASVGSVAPFVGLLGTVVGIIAAFQGIATSGAGGIAAVSAGIAEALIETALGLMVAIPAVLFFNHLNTRVTRVELSLTRSAGELLDEMEDNHGRTSDSFAAAA